MVRLVVVKEKKRGREEKKEREGSRVRCGW